MGASFRGAEGDQHTVVLERLQACEVFFSERSALLQGIGAIRSPQNKTCHDNQQDQKELFPGKDGTTARANAMLRMFDSLKPMLTGSDLLNKVKELGDVSKSDLVRACGYVSNKKDGGDRLNFTAFYEALLEAKGVSLGATGIGGVGKGGRKLSYVATVQGNGNLLIGKAYTALLDLKPGDEFEIKLGRKQIRLMPVGGSEEDEE